MDTYNQEISREGTQQKDERWQGSEDLAEILAEVQRAQKGFILDMGQKLLIQNKQAGQLMLLGVCAPLSFGISARYSSNL